MVFRPNRREFLGAAAAIGLTGARPSETAVVGVMGTGGRGTHLASSFARMSGVEVAYVCDVDRARAAKAATAAARPDGKLPQAVGDFRRILDDKSVDILVVATSNHWHAPAAILGCAAGKHVYVEKPCSHNPREGEILVAAARKHDRRVQMGSQRRSYPAYAEAVAELRNGIIGPIHFARCTYANNRPSIGRGKAVPPPEGLDWDLWQGPAPRRAFRDNYLPYTWHWFWAWGNGEIGNNGVHSIDIARWGLGVDHPVRVTSAGGRWNFDDDQETPDTHVASFEFEGGKLITWEGLSCNRGLERASSGVSFHGEQGTLVLEDKGYTVYDRNNKEVKKAAGGGGGEALHLANFIDAVHGKAKLNAEIGEGHKSTLLCHLGNIAHRTGRALKCDARNGRILDDAEAMKFWSRDYEPGWEPKL